MTVSEWLDAYTRAWEERDADAAVALFTQEAVYRSSPFREPDVGHEGIRGYWERATGTQSGVEVRLGDPVVDGRRAAVEWWTTMSDEGEEITLPGCLVLRFAADGRCQELREYWHVEPGRIDPPGDWGT
jgi:hypothetical protein